MAEGTKSATFGVSAVAYGEYSTSLGSESSANGEYDTSVGYGAQFSGGNSTSVGAFYRPSEDTMISIGGAMGNGENIVNAGLSFKLGQSNGVSKSKVTMAREIVELSSDNRMMKDQIAALTDKVNALMGILDTSKKATFPDVPENH